MRVAIVTEIPAPFRIPLFNALAARDEVELIVVFLAERDPRRPYVFHADEARFRYRLVRGLELRRGGRWIVIDAGTFPALLEFRPDVVMVGGWNQPAFWQAALYARIFRRALVPWVESTARDTRPGSALLERAKRLIIAWSDAFVVPGRASAEYVRLLAGEDAPITVAPNAVDAALFRDRVDEERRRAEPRARPSFLCVARLDPEKGVDLLLEAAAELDAEVVVLGTGPEEDRLRASAPPNVRFAGVVPRDEMPRWYARADAFVLPSRSEQWGMVLNEAAWAALPIVATEAAGGAYELVEDGVNGFRVRAGDANALGRALTRLAEDRAFRDSAGARSRELAAAFTPEAWAAAVADAAPRWRS